MEKNYAVMVWRKDGFCLLAQVRDEMPEVLVWNDKNAAEQIAKHVSTPHYAAVVMSYELALKMYSGRVVAV